MTSCFVCATLNLGRKKSTGTEPLAIVSLPVNDRRNVQTRRTLRTGPKDFKIRTLDRLDFFSGR